ncbi:MAG: class A beta-lactamase-related serine hydrolase [Chloroflexi bacterium]|nr:class A beta-lactamase-related serine hydrolase [Chloroflexota bacterium]
MSDGILDAATPQIQSRISKILAERPIPGVMIGVVRDQRLAYTADFGFADVTTGRRFDGDTLCRVASITKTFTGTGIMQLRDLGKLNLDDPLVRFLPEFKAIRCDYGSPEDVTLRQLLCHHSGLMGEPPMSHWETFDFPSMGEILELLPQIAVVIPPRTTYKYSNLGLSLLGEVITRVSGRPYREYIWTEILEPLGMASSTFELTEALTERSSGRSRVATGYDPSPYSDIPTPAVHKSMNGMAAAGQLYSSVNDLGKWLALQFRTAATARAGAQILRGATLNEMHQPQYMEPDWATGYGIPWRSNRIGENVYIGHGGGLPGFSSQIYVNEHYRTGAVVLTNTGEGRASELAIVILETILAEEKKAGKRLPSEKPTPIPVDWQRFLGPYLWSLNTVQHIEYHNGELSLATPATSAAPTMISRLRATDQPLVFMVENGRYAGEPLTFRQAADGKIKGFSASSFAYRKLVEI